MFKMLTKRLGARNLDPVFPDRILIVARGGYGGHYIKKEMEKKLPNAKIHVVKREYLDQNQINEAQVIIFRGYGDSFSTKKITVYKKENVDLPEIEILRNHPESEK